MGKCSCKKLCINCEHILTGYTGHEYADTKDYTCSKIPNTKTSCVTGEKVVTYPLCSKMNKNGNCCWYIGDKHKLRKEELLKAVKNYVMNDIYLHKTVYEDENCKYSEEENLIMELERCLEGDKPEYKLVNKEKLKTAKKFRWLE